MFNLVLSTGAQLPDNDRCINREILEPFIPVDGNNTEANFDYNNQGVCGPRSDRRAMWYEVKGRGADVTLKVCTNNEVITDFGVFKECNSRKCEGWPPQTFEPANCALNQSVDFGWFAEDNVQYFVQVRADLVDGVGSNFTIMYEDESLDGPLTDSPTRSPSSSSELNGGDEDSAVTWSLAGVAATAALLTTFFQ